MQKLAEIVSNRDVWCMGVLRPIEPIISLLMRRCLSGGRSANAGPLVVPRIPTLNLQLPIRDWDRDLYPR